MFRFKKGHRNKEFGKSRNKKEARRGLKKRISSTNESIKTNVLSNFIGRSNLMYFLIIT